MVEKDIRELFSMQRPEVIFPLLESAASRTARLYNVTDIAAPLSLTRPTINVYLHHLENLFLIDRLPPLSNNRMSRLVKTPKLHLTDTGLTSALLGVDQAALNRETELLGQLVETFVYGELRRQSQWSDDDYRFYHLRDKTGIEVDLVIERNGRMLCGVEVKAGATVGARDFKALSRLRDAMGERFLSGVVLHDGEEILPFGDRLFAVPLSQLWVAGAASRKTTAAVPAA
jgi:predicted AAA+ superfamily ATPase